MHFNVDVKMQLALYIFSTKKKNSSPSIIGVLVFKESLWVLGFALGSYTKLLDCECSATSYSPHIFQEKAMADLVLEGPLGNHFLCKVPANTTVGVTQDEDFLYEQPFGAESRELAASEKGRYLFLKMKGEHGVRF